MESKSMSKAAKTSAFVIVYLILIVALAPAAEPNATEAFKMNKLLGRGINLGNALEAPNEGELGVTLKEEYFDIIKQAGFDSVRLPVRWSAHALSEKPYTIDPKFFKRVDWAVNCALSRNLPVTLDVHHYHELCGDPANHKDRFLALWRQIAEHYRDYPDTLVFELLNDPYNKIRANELNLLLKQSLAVVRESNPNRIVVFGSANYNNIDYLKFLKIPKEDRNIIATFHYYEPYQFTHQGVSWEKDSNDWLGKKWVGSDAEKQAVVKEFDIAADWAKENSRPINLGEFGVHKNADMDSRARWTKFVTDTAVERGFSIHYWEFCADEFGLYDQQTKSFRKPLLEAVVPPKK